LALHLLPLLALVLLPQTSLLLLFLLLAQPFLFQSDTLLFSAFVFLFQALPFLFPETVKGFCLQRILQAVIFDVNTI
jgi:hypothetical protein